MLMAVCLWIYTPKRLKDFPLGSKIEKVPRGIRGEKSSKDMASSRNYVSTIGAFSKFEPNAHVS